MGAIQLGRFSVRSTDQAIIARLVGLGSWLGVECGVDAVREWDLERDDFVTFHLT